MRRLQQEGYEVVLPAVQDGERNSTLHRVHSLMSTKLQEKEPTRELVKIPSHTMRHSALITCIPTEWYQI